MKVIYHNDAVQEVKMYIVFRNNETSHDSEAIFTWQQIMSGESLKEIKKMNDQGYFIERNELRITN